MATRAEITASSNSKPGWWAGFWQTVIRYEGDKITPWLALRNSIGITLPLLFGVITGTLSSTVVITTGALNFSFSDNDDPYIHRARRMLGSSVLVGIAVFLGSMSGHHHWSSILLATVWALGAGILVSVGTVASDLGVISLVTLVVFQASPAPWHRAAISGLLAFGGGLLQTSLSLALWAVRR